MSRESQHPFTIISPWEITACPDWVIDSNPVTDQPAADAPWSISLLDYQLRASDEHHTEFRRMRQWVMDESRIEEGSQFLFEVLPGAQRLAIHRCVIVRNGSTIDALDADNIRMMQRDSNLESHVTSNRLTVELTIDDLRVGDMIEIETSQIELRGEHPLYGHFLRSFFWCRWSVPVGNQRLRVINDSTDTLTLHEIDSQRQLNNKTSIAPAEHYDESWQPETLKRCYGNYPAKYWPHCIAVNKATSWSDTSSYLYNHYQKNGLFDDTPDCSELDLDFNASDTAIVNIIRFVQDNIRYRSESDGIFTHTPKLPSRTLKKRAGDCKDKSTLLLHLLRKVGVDAHLALVSTRLRDGIEDQCPGPFLFDHMIIRFTHEGRDYFVDATEQKRGGTLASLAPLPFKLCLPITDTDASLQTIPDQTDNLELLITHSFDFSQAKSTCAKVTIERQFRQRRANNMRYYLASQNLASMQQSYHESSASDLGVKLECIKPLQIVSDNRDENTLTVQEQYTFSATDDGLQNGRIHVSSDFLSDLSVADEADHPLDLSLSGAVQHRINICYPKKPDSELENHETDNQWFHYSDASEVVANELRFSIDLTPRSSIVATDQLDEYRKQVKSVSDRSTTSFPVLLSGDNKKMAMHMWCWAIGLTAITYFVNAALG